MVARPSSLPPQAALPSLCVVLALRAGRSEAVRAWLAGLARVSRAEGALSLRLARICAWLKGQDLAPLGFSSWSAFAAEHVELRDSWLRGLIRLVESPLDLVKEAVCTGLLPLRVAVGAPSRTTPADEADWLQRAVLGSPTTTGHARSRKDLHPAPVARPVPLSAEECRRITEARALARLLRGRQESTRAVDAWILARWRAGATSEALIAEAQEAPPAPAPPPLTWCTSPDPATDLVGPWSEPEPASDPEAHTRALQQAFDALCCVQDLRRAAVMVLGVAWDESVRHAVWADVGLANAEALATEVLGRSSRSLQRYRRLGRSLGYHEDVRRELQRGALDLDRAELAMEAARLCSAEPWVALARRVCKRELRRIAARARHEGGRAMAPYHRATVAGGPLPSVARGWVALPPSEEHDAHPPLRVDPELPAAAAWLLATVKIPPQRGFGRVKERDAFVCQNPLCGRRALRNHAHHLVFRAHGGGDELENGITLCSGCHLRLVHAGRVSVEIDGGDLIWRYPLDTVIRVLGGVRRPPQPPVPLNLSASSRKRKLKVVSEP